MKKKYIGLDIDWNYDSNHKHATIGMPKFTPSTLTKLRHSRPIKPPCALAKHTTPTCSGKVKKAEIEDDSEPILPPSDAKCI